MWNTSSVVIISSLKLWRWWFLFKRMTLKCHFMLENISHYSYIPFTILPTYNDSISINIFAGNSFLVSTNCFEGYKLCLSSNTIVSLYKQNATHICTCKAICPFWRAFSDAVLHKFFPHLAITWSVTEIESATGIIIMGFRIWWL